MLDTQSGRLREARRNDVQEAETIRQALIEDVLSLQEISERRNETLQKLKEHRQRTALNVAALAETIKRENEIDNVRLQPLLESIKSNLRSDLLLLSERGKVWENVYNRKKEVDLAISAVNDSLSKESRGDQANDCTDIDGMTAAIRQDAVLLIRLGGALQVLRTVSDAQACSSDPFVHRSIENANETIKSIALKRLGLLEKALDLASTSKAKNASTISIIIETALDGVMAACSAISIQPSELGLASPDGRAARVLVMEASSFVKTHEAELIKSHQGQLIEAMTNGSGEILHNKLRSLHNSRLRHKLMQDADLLQTVNKARRARRVLVVSAYKRLKCALGWARSKGTVKVRSFRHAKSRQMSVGDATPTGMLSEWSYNASDDKYHYPKGHESIGDLSGLELGATVCKGLKRIEKVPSIFSVASKSNKPKTKEKAVKTAFVGVEDVTSIVKKENVLEWLFEVAADEMDPNTPPIYSLKVRAQSSVSGLGRVSWSVRGGRRAIKNEDGKAPHGQEKTKIVPTSVAERGNVVEGTLAPETLCQKLGHAAFIDFGEIARKNKWNWFKISVRPSLAAPPPKMSGKYVRGHLEDVQLFRSKVTSGVDPQLCVQIGISLTKRTEKDLKAVQNLKTDSLKFQELQSCIKECNAHGVWCLGSIAKELMREAEELAASKIAESR